MAAGSSIALRLPPARPDRTARRAWADAWPRRRARSADCPGRYSGEQPPAHRSTGGRGARRRLVAGGDGRQTAAGWVLFASSMLAAYVAGAMMIAGVWGRTVLPLGEYRNSANGRELAPLDAPGIVAHERADGLRIQEGLVAHRGAARADQVGLSRRLEHVADGADAQRLEEELLVVVHREHQHADLGLVLQDPPRGLQPGELRHRDVEDGEVDVVPLRADHGLRAVLRLRDDREIGLVVEDPAQPGAHERVVVGEQDAGGHGQRASGT